MEDKILNSGKKERYFSNIDEVNKKIDDFYTKTADLNNLGIQVKSVVYNRILYPIIYQTNEFFYLGGENVYIILKSKCSLKDTGKSKFYEAIASDNDIFIGKSPIIPIGCTKIPYKIKSEKV